MRRMKLVLLIERTETVSLEGKKAVWLIGYNNGQCINKYLIVALVKAWWRNKKVLPMGGIK